MKKDEIIYDLISYINYKEEMFTFYDLESEMKINFNLAGVEFNNEELDDTLNIALSIAEEKGIITNFRGKFINNNVIIKLIDKILDSNKVLTKFGLMKSSKDDYIFEGLQEEDIEVIYDAILATLVKYNMLANVNGKYVSLKTQIVAYAGNNHNIVYTIPKNPEKKETRSM